MGSQKRGDVYSLGGAVRVFQEKVAFEIDLQK